MQTCEQTLHEETVTLKVRLSLLKFCEKQG